MAGRLGDIEDRHKISPPWFLKIALSSHDPPQTPPASSSRTRSLQDISIYTDVDRVGSGRQRAVVLGIYRLLSWAIFLCNAFHALDCPHLHIILGRDMHDHAGDL